MRISAKVDYAVRAAAELAVRSPGRTSGATTGETLGDAQGIPTKYLENILAELRRSGIVGSRRGADGGYWLARPADEVSIADIVRAVEGPLADVRGEAPEDLSYEGPAQPLERVWIATRASIRQVLEATTLAHLVADQLPDHVAELLTDESAWTRRSTS
jgi:Rrf2 family protein